MTKRFDNTTYVPALNPTAPPVEARPEPTRDGVSAQVQGNMAGGIGAASVVVALWLLAWGALHGAGLVDGAWPDFGRVAIGAAIAGLLVFGGLMFVRNSTDEFFDTAKQIAMERYIADLEAGVALRDQTIADERRLRKLAEAQASVFSARQPARDADFVKPLPTLGPEWDDAEALVIRRYNGTGWARDAVTVPGSGWNNARWKAAMLVLDRAGIAVNTPNAGYQPWDDKATIVDALAVFHRYKDDTISALEAQDRRVAG